MVVTQPLLEPNNALLRNKQLEDDTTGLILRSREADCKPDEESLRKRSRAVRQLFQLWDQLVVVNSVLYRRFKYFKRKQDHLQLVVPSSMRDAILEESHAGSLGGYLGEDKTLIRVHLARICRTGQTVVQNMCPVCDKEESTQGPAWCSAQC